MTSAPATELKFPRPAYADGPRLLADIGATHARFALDIGALRLKRCYITVKRAQADAGLRGKGCTTHRHAVGTKNLQQIKKPL